MGQSGPVSGGGREPLLADVRAMLAASERLLDTAGSIESRFNSTRDGVDHLLGQYWKSIASDAHRELWSDWDEGFTAVQTGLKGMAAKIAEAARAFDRVDNR